MSFFLPILLKYLGPTETSHNPILWYVIEIGNIVVNPGEIVGVS